MSKFVRNKLLAALSIAVLLGCATTAGSDGSNVDTTIASRGVQVPVTLVTPAGTEPVPLAILIHGHGGTRH